MNGITKYIPKAQTNKCINGIELPNTAKFLTTISRIIQLSRRDFDKESLFLSQKFSSTKKPMNPAKAANIKIQILKRASLDNIPLSLAVRSINKSSPNNKRLDNTRNSIFILGITFVHFLFMGVLAKIVEFSAGIVTG